MTRPRTPCSSCSGGEQGDERVPAEATGPRPVPLDERASTARLRKSIPGRGPRRRRARGTGTAVCGDASETSPAAGPDPADVRHERVDVLRRLEVAVAEGRHLDHLPAEEDAADRVPGDARDTALGDPLPQLAVVAHQLVEICAPEAGDVALEGAGVRHAPGAQRPMARKAAELRGALGA